MHLVFLHQVSQHVYQNNFKQTVNKHTATAFVAKGFVEKQGQYGVGAVDAIQGQAQPIGQGLHDRVIGASVKVQIGAHQIGTFLRIGKELPLQWA
jgi:hypothetical protein